MMIEKISKGFTLIELVIVIGILAILAAAVVLVLNPAQLLAQARDSQRLSDLGSIKSAIALYLATNSSPIINVGPTCTATGCAGSVPTDGPFTDTETVTNSTAVDGNGWVRIAFSVGATGGPTMSSLPIDPTNLGNYFYAYKGDSTSKTFELDARLESTKYRIIMANDGGDKNVCTGNYVDTTCYYEIGTEPGLDL